jgi:hypothetical protein
MNKNTFIAKDIDRAFDVAARTIPNVYDDYMYMFSKVELNRVKHIFKHIDTRCSTAVSDTLGTKKGVYKQ